jgi:hypothetical protein
MWHVRGGVVVLGLVLGVEGQSALAQTDGRGYAGVKVGANIERAEDDVRGTTGGAGALVGFALSDRWDLEGEFWYPGDIRTDPEDGRHRDTLLGANLRRSFGGGAVRPHVLFGATVGITEDEFTICTAVRTPPGSSAPETVLVSCSDPDVTGRHTDRFTGLSLFPLLGAGAEFALTERVRLIPDVRVQAWITSVIVRPAVAMVITF